MNYYIVFCLVKYKSDDSRWESLRSEMVKTHFVNQATDYVRNKIRDELEEEGATEIDFTFVHHKDYNELSFIGEFVQNYKEKL